MAATPLPEPPSVLVKITIVVGLPVALWAYKRTIIYFGWLPWGSRRQKLEDIHPLFLSELHCEEVRINSERGVTLYGILVRQVEERNDPPDTVILYLQGNAGNPLQRMNIFYKLLRGASYRNILPLAPKTAVLAVAPRSFWKSTNCRATQRGILADHRHALNHALAWFPSARIVVYGHSLGGAAALCLLASLTDVPPDSGSGSGSGSSDPGIRGASMLCRGFGARRAEEKLYDERYKNIVGLVLENPLASIEGIVHYFYPQRWLPYHYLGYLALDKWDALAAVWGAVRAARACDVDREDGSRGERGEVGVPERPSVLSRLLCDALFIVSHNDEVVPPIMGVQLYKVAREICRASSESPRAEGEAATGGREEAQNERETATERERGVKSPKLTIVWGAQHNTAWDRLLWLVEMRRYLAKFRDEER